eukprot:3834605-Prymnesium_polylepis.1
MPQVSRFDSKQCEHLLSQEICCPRCSDLSHLISDSGLNFISRYLTWTTSCLIRQLGSKDLISSTESII